ncbi:MAG: hypothetical protein ACMXYG_03410 [Candidatus Woesearchaeota archaeon]
MKYLLLVILFSVLFLSACSDINTFRDSRDIIGKSTGGCENEIIERMCGNEPCYGIVTITLIKEINSDGDCVTVDSRGSGCNYSVTDGNWCGNGDSSQCIKYNLCNSGSCSDKEYLPDGSSCGKYGDVCINNECCKADCEGKQCGSDGCLGTCGTCPYRECHEILPCDDGNCNYKVIGDGCTSYNDPMCDDNLDYTRDFCQDCRCINLDERLW